MNNLSAVNSKNFYKKEEGLPRRIYGLNRPLLFENNHSLIDAYSERICPYIFPRFHTMLHKNTYRLQNGWC